MLATLPVKVGYGQLEFFTYALLDSGSQQSFCTRRLADNLKLEGEDHEMRLRAMTQTGEASDLKGELVTFSVSSLEDYPDICELSNVMTVDKLPIRQCQVPEWGELSCWEYLDDAQFPEQKEKSVDLLIGTDHPQASIPLESCYSPESVPVAVKTCLGWTLYWPMSKMDKRKMTNSVSMHV